MCMIENSASLKWKNRSETFEQIDIIYALTVKFFIIIFLFF